ncbi:MAG: cadherin-like domain-containing protein, partial [Magnetococcales bacterium]|nr:cadherin-like domain-containing protein [Magnetococcales bacterium]
PVRTAEPTPEPVLTAEPTPEPVLTAEPTPEPVLTAEPTPEPVLTAEPTPEPVLTAEPTPEPEPTVKPEPEANIDTTAEVPVLHVADASGTEDNAIPLHLSAILTDTDGSETLSIHIAGVPEGAELSAGIHNTDGTWLLSGNELSGLTIHPPANSDVDFNLQVSATSTEADGGASSTITGTLNVSVTPEADQPVLVVHNATGTEDHPIALDLSAVLTDTDGSESLSIHIAGVPEGAELSAGIDNGNGTWTLGPADLNHLSITPAHNSDADFTLSVTATSREMHGDSSASVHSTIDVVINPDADLPVLTLADTQGREDHAIPLDIAIALGDGDGSERLTDGIVLTNIPDGATLNKGEAGADHTWIIHHEDLAVTGHNADGQPISWAVPGLTITPPADSGADFNVGVLVAVHDGVSERSETGTIAVHIAAVADPVDLDVGNAAGTEDTAIPLDIHLALQDTDGSEHLAGDITVTGVPDGAHLSLGEAGPDHTWVIHPEELHVSAHNDDGVPIAWDIPGLTITPATDSDATIALGIQVTTSDGTDSHTVTGVLDVLVTPEADAPTVHVADASGLEDQPIALDIAAALTDIDGSESLSVTISGVPEGATLSAGIDNHDGSWTLTSGQWQGLTITPASNSDDDFSLNVTARSTDGSSTAITTGIVDVQVQGVADQPTVSLDVGLSTLVTVAGHQVYEAPVTIHAALSDTDGSESLSIVVSGLPAGATLSSGTDTGQGTWTLDANHLQGLTVRVPQESGNAPFELTATATAIERDGDTRSIHVQTNVDFTDDFDPQAHSDTAATQSGIAVSIDALANDTSPTGQHLTLHDVTGAAHGTAALVNGKVVYTPDSHFTGEEHLTYHVVDTSGHSDTGSIDITVGTKIDVQGTLENHQTWPGATDTVDHSVINASDSLSDTVNADLYPEGGKITLTVTAQAPEGSLPHSLDLYIIQDLTGSYKDDIATIRGTQGSDNSVSDLGILDDLVHGVNSLVPDTHYGLGSFKDPLVGVDATRLHDDYLHASNRDGLIHDLDLKADLSGSYLDGTKTTHGYDSMSADGGQGGNPNEDQITALNDCAKAAIANQLGFRSGIPKVVIVATDAPSDTSPAEIAECAANLQAANMIPIFLVADGWADLDEMGFYDDMVAQLGRGATVELSGNSDNLVEAIRSGIQEAVGNIHLNIEGDEFGYAKIVDHSATGDGLHTWKVELDAPLGSSHSVDSLEMVVTDAHGDAIGATTTIHVTPEIDVAGTSYNDLLTGHQGDNVMDGGAGDDVISGLGGNDTIDGGTGNDTIDGGAGNDTIDGGAGDDTIQGGQGDDTITGGSGNDTLYGGEGNDLFIFGHGSGIDTVDGGAGAGWLDTIHLDDVTGGPVAQATHSGDWVLTADTSYTVSADHHTIQFDHHDASGAITLEDGSKIEFHNIEQITW